MGTFTALAHSRIPASQAVSRSSKIKFALATLSLMLATACASAGLASEGVTDRDIAVLRTLLARVCSDTNGKHRLVSDVPPHTERLSQERVGSPELHAELLRRNRQPSPRWPNIEACASQKIVAGTRIAKTFASDHRVPPGWEKFEREFPDASGFLEISLPAFSRDGSKAVVYFESKCGILCGAGFVVEFKNENGSWREVRRETAWIS